MSTKEKTPRAPSMTMAQRFELMDFIKSASKATPDRVLAAQASKHFERSVNAQTVTNYRKEFGIPSVGMPTREEMQEQIDAQALRITTLLIQLNEAKRLHQPATVASGD